MPLVERLSGLTRLQCKVDAISIHIYDQATNIDYYKNYITEVGELRSRPLPRSKEDAYPLRSGQRYNKPVWVTEESAACSSPAPALVRR